MRVVWVSHRDLDDPRAGGSERFSFEVLRRLAEMGETVRWVTTSGPFSRSLRRESGVEIQRIGRPWLGHATWPLVLHSTPRPDVVVDELGHVVPWGSERFGGTPGTAYFQHLHRRTLPGQVSPVAAQILGRIESSYRRVYPTWPFATGCESSARDLETIGIARRRIRVIPLGVDLDRFAPGPRSEHPSLLYFGGLKRYKRPEVAIDLLAALRARGLDASLTVLGSGPLVEALVQRAGAAGVAEHVRFAGRLPDEEVPQLVRSAWLNVHASVAEGWCLSALEAAASGVPTVAFDVVGVRDTVGAGRSGELVPDGDLASMVEAAGRLLAEPERYREGSRHWAEQFPWSRTAESWREYLSSLR